MRLWKRNRTAETDAEFDVRMLRSRASFIEHYNATFDFEAGLDEVYARAGLPRPESLRRTTTATAASEAGSDNSFLQQICDHIDMIDTLLSSVAAGDVGPVVTATYLTTSRQSLLQLRTGLQARRLTHWDAFNLIRNVQHNLSQIDLVMRRHHGLSLDEALHERIGELTEINTDISEQMERLEASVNRLFDTEHEAVELVPSH
ncbi:hypothetical protein [Spirillospora sp. CA-128828]|uniref:hypothetical protein n=1 Tax=Spirillospora sp. CA-128828 TaxID=3240033 RepID=UPI003D8E67D2